MQQNTSPLDMLESLKRGQRADWVETHEGSDLLCGCVLLLHWVETYGGCCNQGRGVMWLVVFTHSCFSEAD